MNFNSLEFLIFLPVVLAGYWLLPFRMRWAWLLGASWYFYMSWDFRFIVLILFTTVVTYACGLGIQKYPDKKKIWLVLAVTLCFGELFIFKYTDFFIQSLADALKIFGINVMWNTWNILLPVGISFYTFQAMSYVIDVYRGDTNAETHFGYYALFVAYFPQLVAGPIERSRDLLFQLRKEQAYSWENTEAGVRILLCGFFRKCVIADTCGIYVNRVFQNLDQAEGMAVFVAGLLFCFQMYCDFAGYSEIAMGAARIMGIRLTKNFDRPYLSLTYTEFFRRWHITLGRWFTDYVYIPLGGNRKGMPRKLRNTVIVFFLCGLWHGASWNYVFWGLYAAFFMCMESLMKKPFRSICATYGIRKNKGCILWIRHVIMMFIFVPAALLFRSSGMKEVAKVFGILFQKWTVNFEYIHRNMLFLGIGVEDFILLLLCLMCMCLIYYLEEYNGSFFKTGSEETVEWEKEIKTVIYLFLIFSIILSWISLSAGGDTSAFAYFQF